MWQHCKWERKRAGKGIIFGSSKCEDEMEREIKREAKTRQREKRNKFVVKR